jgi:hypothetical protein
MPSERSPFGSPVEPISPPPEPSENEGLGWRRRVPPPGPKDVFRCPFIAVSALRRQYTYMTSGRKREAISARHSVNRATSYSSPNGRSPLCNATAPSPFLGAPSRGPAPALRGYLRHTGAASSEMAVTIRKAVESRRRWRGDVRRGSSRSSAPARRCRCRTTASTAETSCRSCWPPPCGRWARRRRPPYCRQ